jgi:hypothetical protein
MQESKDEMMRKVVLAALAALLFVCGSVRESAALVCPVPQAGDAGAAIASGEALDDAAKRDAAIAALRGKGVGNGAIVDSLVAAYCPAVERDSALTEAQKRAKVRRFAARVARTVYNFQDVEAVILDVPFAPDVAAQINARAAAEKVSPEAWVAEAITRALKAAR